jgi:threonine/homoserine efflux transporter RhtA
VALLGTGCALALEFGWLGQQWQGIWPYLLPLVIWQGSSCLGAAFSYLPFENHKARNYSWACMAVAGVQGSVLLLPTLHIYTTTAQMHLLIYGVVSAFAFIALTFYVHRLGRQVQQAKL